MARSENFRDYLYVSGRKVSRMAQTLESSRWKRVKKLDLNIGPIGGGVELAEDDPKRAIALVPEIERAIDERSRIRYFSEPDLQVGHWFVAEGLPMNCLIERDRQAVLFYGEMSTQLILGGSAKYLLDRAVPDNAALPDRLDHSSDFVGIRHALESMAASEVRATEVLEGAEIDLEPPYALKPISEIDGEFGRAYDALEERHGRGREPLTAVARCLHIHRRFGQTVVVGTPLYVAFHVPD